MIVVSMASTASPLFLTTELIDLFTGQSWKALFKDEFRRERLLLKRQHFAQSRDSSYILALPSSPPLLPIMGPAYFPMLPPPPAILRELMSFPH